MPLKQKLANKIQKSGAISLAEYMAICLYDDEYGYYRKKDPLGKEGDFTTAPEISQVFGELIGVWLITSWQASGSPKNPIIVEPGPGRGTLMADILRVAEKIPEFYKNISVHLVEVNEALIKEQKKALSKYEAEIHWHKSIDTLPEKPVFLVANEFFDALPIHQFIMTKDGWRERLIAVDANNNFVFITSKIETPHIALIPKKLSDVEEGGIYEVCPEGIKIIKNIAERIKNYGGAALAIDYGYYNNNFKDSFQAVKNHKYHDPFKNPGDVDLTAHVNFTRLGKEAEKMGVRAQGNITQGEFLINMGIELRAAMLMKNASEIEQKNIKSGVERLLFPSQMGSLFKCLALTNKNAPGAYGFI